MILSSPILLLVGGAVALLCTVSLRSHARRRHRLADALGGRRAGPRLSRSDLYRRPYARAGLVVGTALVLGAAASGPRFPTFDIDPPPPPPTRSLIIAIDVSASMQAADVQPTRLGKAVAVAEGLIEALERERVGLVLFAGEAYPLAPPTGDHEALRYLLGGVTPTIASAHDPGTLLSVGVRASVALLAADTESEGDRAIIVIGDGEAGELDDAVAAVAAEAASGGVAIHAIGVGTAAGAGMVMPQAPYQLGGRIVDASGAPVISHLREPTLARLAAAGGGQYVHTDDARGLQALFGRFEAPEPTPPPLHLDSFWTRYEPAHWLTAAALLLLLLESLADVRGPGRRPVARIARRTA